MRSAYCTQKFKHVISAAKNEVKKCTYNWHYEIGLHTSKTEKNPQSRKCIACADDTGARVQ
jgi:hypothetical protein